MKQLKFAKKIKRLTITTVKKRANTVYSKYIRTRDMLLNKHYGTDTLKCFTCLKPYVAFGVRCAQAGHFLPGRHSAVLYDERACHGQCYNCNINLKGNWVKYEERMIRDYGQAVVDELKTLDRTNPHYKVEDYLEIEEKFIRKLEAL
jgi:hypothetical protein